MTAIQQFCDLVERLGPEGISRGENDLSSRLARCFEQIGLHTVIDTSSGQDNRRRPDIVAYLDEGASDLCGFGEVVVESKKPSEIAGDLLDALLGTDLWSLKFVPYVRSHLPSIRYFCLTTFERHLFIEITPELKSLIAFGDPIPSECERQVRQHSVSHDITDDSGAWIGWINSHLHPDVLAPPVFSSILDLFSVATKDDLEAFADQLATFVAGEVGTQESRFALLNSVRIEAENLSDLSTDIAASLSIYVLAQNPGMSVEAGQELLNANLESELTNFLSASIQSLIGRMFAFKMIEDCFCLDVNPPLIPEQDFIFHSERYDGQTPSDLVRLFFLSVRNLEQTQSPAISNLSKTGRFYDWIESRVNPNAFERVFRAFASRNFASLSGDLLGRFFEHYAQRVDKRRRRAFGQYYTPQPVVEFIWSEALRIAEDSGASLEIRALDPGVGSATFLTEGARRMSSAGVPSFWHRLVGFDIDPQVIGVAYVNLFLAVLSGLERQDADSVEQLHLYPTDALEPTSAAPLNAYLPLLTAEPLRQYLAGQIEMSANVKAQNSYDLVIGNPPYKNNSKRTLQQVAEVFPSLLQTSRSNARLRERNIRDDYAWFFAAADYYIQNEGLIGFVVSSSFCTADSYRFFRIDLLRKYEIRRLVHLGTGIFEDVGPRTSFVIILLERRERSVSAEEIGSHEFDDLRYLEAANERLSMLTEGARSEWRNWPQPEVVSPAPENGFRLLPTDPLVPRVRACGLPLFAGRDEPSIFNKKWPGFITALDSLWRADTRQELREKIEAFFSCAHASSSRERLIEQFIGQQNFQVSDAERVRCFVEEVRLRHLQFDVSKLKRVVSGSSANSDCWYPSPNMTSWVYFEPSLRVPRNVNEGRPVGYGTMTQWGEPEAHATFPKLVFTTAAAARNGLKAYVVRDEWFVKLHGGTRQQFNYTVCENPLRGSQLDGLPNNLSHSAAQYFEVMRQDGWDEEDFLLYIAAFYNTDVANEFLEGGGGKTMYIPFADPTIANAILHLARRLQLLAVAEHLFTVSGEVNARDVPYDLSALVAERLFDEDHTGGGRFQATRIFRASPSTKEAITASRSELQEELEPLVRAAIGLD